MQRAAGGEINCADGGDYGLVSISKSITIDCDNTKAGIRVTSSSNAITIAGAASDVVTLKGLDLVGSGSVADGINLVTVGTVHVHKVTIKGFSVGIDIQTNVYSELYVADSLITNSGDFGILVAQGASASSNTVISRVRLENNSTGIRLNANSSTGAVFNALVVDSVVSGSGSQGIEALTGAGKAAITLFVDRNLISGNFGSGIKADGAAASGAGSATIRLNDSSIMNNVTGVSTAGAGPGVVQSYKNNRINANFTDGTPLTAVPGPGGTPLQ